MLAVGNGVVVEDSPTGLIEQSAAAIRKLIESHIQILQSAFGRRISNESRWELNLELQPSCPSISCPFTNGGDSNPV